MKRSLLSIVVACWCCLAVADPTPVPVRAEIDALLARLQASGCQFSRNGSWYSGSDARVHLIRKLEYIEGKTTIQATEQFIELAASKSSTSGRAYQVRCGNQAAVTSQAWLTQQLGAMRGR